MMDTQLLPAPPKRRPGPGRYILIAVGILFALSTVGTIGRMATRPDAVPNVSPPALEPGDFTSGDNNADGLAVGEAAGIAAPLLDEAAAELLFITETSAVSADLRHLNSAAALLDRAGDAWDGVDATLAGYLHSSADHVYAAARAESSGDFAGMQREIQAATQDLTLADQYTRTLLP